MSIDIEYLLFLQNCRNVIGDVFDPFMEWVSNFGIRELMLVAAFVYWCINKRTGLLALFAMNISRAMNGVVKLTACSYRPWIRDPRIVPAGDSIKTATGYSFPSGHTMIATPVYVTFAMSTGKKILKFICIAALLITAFSRNYLGVHTPQDVIVGLVLGLLAIYIAKRTLDYLDRHPEKDIFVTMFCVFVGIMILVYITYKPYPMDYVDGKLLVDPAKMTRDVWGDIGGFTAFAVAWLIDRRFIKFESTGWNVMGVILCVIGLFPLNWILYKSYGAMSGFMGLNCARFSSKALFSLYIVVVWPLVLKFFCRKKA